MFSLFHFPHSQNRQVSSCCPGFLWQAGCVVQLLSCVWLFAAPLTAACQASSPRTMPVLHYLSEFTQIHVHWSVMLSSHLTLCCPLILFPLIFPRVCVFSNEPALGTRWPEYWNFSLSISPFKEYSGWFPLWLNSLMDIQMKEWNIHWGEEFGGCIPWFSSQLDLPEGRRVFCPLCSLDQKCHGVWYMMLFLICKSKFIVMRAQWAAGYSHVQEIPTFLCISLSVPRTLISQSVWLPVSLEVPAFLCLPMDPSCLQDVRFPATWSLPLFLFSYLVTCLL